MNENMSDYEARPEDGAVNVYGNDMSDEFPILKAFQEYVDAEQAKSRKRMLLLCVFFSFILCTVIGVFVVLLIASSARIQTLNDRLVEFVMKDRNERLQAQTTPASPVVPAVAPVAQPEPAPVPQKQDDSVMRTLVGKLESLQKAIVEERERAAKADKEAAEKADRKTAEMEAKLAVERAAKLAAEQAAKIAAEEAAEHKRQKTAESAEIERLKVLLATEKEKIAIEQQRIAAEQQKMAAERQKVAAEKEKIAAEREKQRQAELEAYRRKQYPELYGQKPTEAKAPSPSKDSTSRRKALSREQEEADREIDEILKDIKPISDPDVNDEDAAETKKVPVRQTNVKQTKEAESDTSDISPSAKKPSKVGSWGIPED